MWVTPLGHVPPMNLQVLIDSIIRQTTVLIAQLATAQGVRAPLANVANQVFLDLSNELASQGLSRKVSADMFGMALRTYQRKIQRLTESSTDQGRSLWSAVLSYLEGSEVVTRSDVLCRFHRDDDDLVRGVLHDLCESGLVFRTGSGRATAYRVIQKDELGALSRSGEDDDGQDELVWALIYREGPIGKLELAKLLRFKGFEISLTRLESAGRIRRRHHDGLDEYSASEFFVARDASVGWEAAVFDHFQALVKTIAAKLEPEAEKRGEQLGGSTYTCDVWPGHPFEQELLGQLRAFRERTSELRTRIRAHNDSHEKPAKYLTVTLYAGQNVLENDSASAASPDESQPVPSPLDPTQELD